VSNEFLRIGKGGKQVWIQAAYNPTFDGGGNIFKVAAVQKLRDALAVVEERRKALRLPIIMHGKQTISSI
jgi:methyl-accepting chemotaxis protein